MNSVRCQKPVGNALRQTVLVERVTEIGVGVRVLLAARRRSHRDLGRGFEPLQNFAPDAVVTRAAPVALVHQDKVEELPGILAIEAGPALVSGHRLVGRKIHLAALHRETARDSVPRLAEGEEVLGYGIVDENVPVSQEQNLRPAAVASGVPTGLPELPAYLKGDRSLT